MLTSIALVFLVGMFFGFLFEKIRLPSLMGMITTGILLGPYALNALDDSLLTISADLRQIALVIILFRAGLSLNTEDFKKMGSSAIFMSFVPALFEISAVLLMGSFLFDLSLIELAIMGSVLAAVSPAVVVPAMLNVIKEGYGQERRVPQLVLTGASMDDVLVIVLFSSFVTLSLSGEFSPMNILEIPIAIIMGILLGVIIGWCAQLFFSRFLMRDTSKVIVLLSLSFLLLEFEELIAFFIPFSSLLSIMALGVTMNQFHPKLSNRLAIKYSKLWAAAQILLFVLVGATVDITYALRAGLPTFLLIIGALIIRMVGVYISLLRSPLNKNEKLFAMISYTPKATVQAAIGGIPLAMGLESGQLILTVSVLSILITAPLGSFAIEQAYKKLLDKSIESKD